jgi:hypothetical protein
MTKMMALFCKGCNDIFAIPSRRGRPPEFCTKCAIKDEQGELPITTTEQERAAERLLAAKERVDRLELMLRANHSHISQHRERYPWSTQ